MSFLAETFFVTKKLTHQIVNFCWATAQFVSFICTISICILPNHSVAHLNPGVPLNVTTLAFFGKLTNVFAYVPLI